MSLTAAREPCGGFALPAFAASDPRIGRLRDIILEESYQEGDFTLSSGRASTYFFQLRQTTMHPEGANLIGDLVVDFMRRHGVRCVGGLELGAVPVVSAASLVSFREDYDIKAFFVRKKPKEHGARELLDGHIEAGAKVLVVDDVTTTGGSILRAIELIADKNCIIDKALSVVDREEGAADRLAQRGIELHSLFSRSDFKGV